MKKLIKLTVCAECLSDKIVDINCVCTYKNNYETIELEFEQCECCGVIADQPAKTEFNDEQLSKLN